MIADLKTNMVQIRSKKDGTLLFSSRKHDPELEAENISEVAKIRCDAGFEHRYGFDGVHEDGMGESVN